MKKYTLAFDFDGVFHKLNPRHVAKGIQTIDGQEIDNATQHIKLLLEQYYIFIMTAREDLEEVAKWFRMRDTNCRLVHAWEKEWKVDGVLGITNRKLPALRYIDDRGEPFDSWTQVVTRHFH